MLIPKAGPRGQVKVVRRLGLPARRIEEGFWFAAACSIRGPNESGKRVGNYIRGPQSPKYRGPKTGATWSGRGRAPAWLANVRDRSAFLIGGKVSAAATTNSAKIAAAR
ncbi:H-NS family nucleoid-associated regulatory protein [Paraburkholderia sp.]|uniref:H-NS family nucleoid-associated regulatory protein n=1 Tax=Paraburkholderia sp. TaxID=1926495 RepID=UPI00257D5A43|nr:H-NS family nucleoid-associated regulatory protein [Paraburkholderia sp.]